MATYETASQGVADDPWLLVDLLQHEVGVAAFLGNIHVPGNVRSLRSERLAASVEVLDAFGGKPCELSVFEVDDIARGAQDGDGIGDVMELSEWDLRGSVMDTKVHHNIRIDHLSLQLSAMEMDVEKEAIASKTWYLLASKLKASAETAVQVVNPTDSQSSMKRLIKR